MVEFQAHAELSVVLDQRSLQSARRQIENDLGDVTAGIAPTGGGGAVGSRGPEPATVDLSRRQLGQQESLVELAQARNELLEDLRGQGPGGGGGGAGSTLLQVQGARSLLGGAAGGAAAGGAAGLGGLAAAGGVGTLGLLVSLFGEGTFEGRSPTGVGAPGDNPPGGLPEREPLSLAIPEGFPPELRLPTEFPSIGIDAPPWLQDVAQGLGIDINVNTQSEVQVSQETRNAERQRFEVAAEQRKQEILREAESIAQSEVQRFEQRLKRELGGGTGSRTVHGVLGTEPGE